MIDNTDPYGPSDEFDPTPQHERAILDLPDEASEGEPNFCSFCKMPVGDDSICGSCLDDSSDDDDNDYEGQECPVCGYDLDRAGECTGNGCGADLSS